MSIRRAVRRGEGGGEVCVDVDVVGLRGADDAVAIIGR